MITYTFHIIPVCVPGFLLDKVFNFHVLLGMLRVNCFFSLDFVVYQLFFHQFLQLLSYPGVLVFGLGLTGVCGW